ncbi:MAG: ATP-binding protein [Myxococcota bacterium]
MKVPSLSLPSTLPLRILDSMRESVLVTSAQLREPGPTIVYVNEAFTRATGYAREEVIGRTPRLLQGKDTDRSTLDRLRTSLETRGEFRGTAVNYRKSGEPFLNEWYIYGLGDGPKPDYYVSVQQEVTNFEAVQRHRHALVRGLVSSNLVLGIFDRQGRVSIVSEALALALGRDPFELHGAPARTLTESIVDAVARTEFDAALATRTPWAGDLVVADPHGRESVLAVQLAPLPVDDDPTAPAFLCTGVDETQNRRYRAVADSIALANELAGAFGTLRHELGNPINNLSAALTVLQRTWSSMQPDALTRLFSDMDEEVSRMKFLIRSLRGFSGTESLRREEFALRAIVENVGKLLRRQLKDASTQFVVEVPPDLALFSDPRAMLQVVLNLCINAVDAMEHAPTRVLTVRSRRVDGGVVLQVEDTGRGMDAKTREAATRAFYTSKENGTGLGLAISRSLVSRMNGSLSIESTPAKGTTVTVWMAQRSGAR